MAAARGFSPEVRDFSDGLAADNSTAWFHAHRDTFERHVRDPMGALLDALAEELGGKVKLFRQNREVRFSKDPSPYKTNTYGTVSGSRLTGCSLYASISADGLVAATGIYEIEPEQLARFRTAVDDDLSGEELERLVADAERVGLETVSSATLKTAPRGVPKDHPRIGLLRRKDLVLRRELPLGARGITQPRAQRFVRETWEAAAPVARWLDAHVGPGDEPEVAPGRL